MTQIYRRHARMEASSDDDGTIRMRISTDEPCDMGGWREVLSHEEGAVDTSAARSLLINHDSNQIAGPIRSLTFEGKTADAEAKVNKKATLQSGVNVLEAVRDGSLAGVSIGYTYDRTGAEIDEDTRTVTVKRWRLLEVSLTPIPADAAAGVRSLPDFLSVPNQPARPAAQEKGARAMEPEQKPTEPGKDLAAIETAKREAIASAKAEAKEVVQFARSYGIEADAVIGMSMVEAKDHVLAAVRSKLQNAAPAPESTPVGTRVTADAGDRLLAEATVALHRKAGIELGKCEHALVDKHEVEGVNIRTLLVDMARADGIRGASDLDLAAWAAGFIDIRSHGRRDAPNKITAGFSNILANVANKAVLAGLNGYNSATWQLWCTQRNVRDFKQVTNAGLSSGRLIKTPEAEAFPELLQKDGGYNSQLGLYGATVSLSFQALVNDDLGAFMTELRRAGLIAAETIDREAYSKLINATWTHDTSTSAALTTAANLDKGRAALRGKLSPAGSKMGIIARFLLHAPGLAVAAQQATGAIYAHGQTTAPSLLSRTITPVESHWIGDTSLKSGGNVTTDYYLTGDGQMVDTVLVNFLEGLGMAPIIQPYDAGAAAAEKWKIMIPFEATAATHTDSAGDARLSGMQKSTA